MKTYDLNVMDIETFTEGEKIFPFCICLKFKSEVYSFWYSNKIVLDLLDWVAENSEGTFIEIYTHNINFDGLVILDGIKDKNIWFDMYVREHNLYWLKILYLKTEILIRCSYKLIPLSVSYLGLMSGMKKKSFPYKFVARNNLEYCGSIPDSKFFNSEEDFLVFKKEYLFFNLKEVTIDYCIQDVLIVYKVLSNILPIIIAYYGRPSILKSSFSFSSVSYKIYSKKYDDKGITLVKTPVSVIEYIRNAYYGGRCEVFGNPIDKELIHYFDYRGMYAQCMMEKYPFGEPILKRSNLDCSRIGFHTIKYRCEDYLPFLPVKSEKLLFPNGVNIGTYWYEEILNAVNSGRCEILDHYSSIEYPEETYLFSDYVRDFMSVREKGVYYNIFGKNMINGLYGSFALREEDGFYVISINESEFRSYYEKTEVLSFKKIGNAYLIKIARDSRSKKVVDKKNKWDVGFSKRNLAYAAVISSKARIKINNSLDLVVKDGGRLYYTDTDSIYAGYLENKQDHTLGDIKWSKTYKDGVFVSSKFYFLKDEPIRLKGVHGNEYKYEEIRDKFYSNAEEIVFKNQLSFIRSNFELHELINEKKISLSYYDKRRFLSGKKETEPINIQTDNVF